MSGIELFAAAAALGAVSSIAQGDAQRKAFHYQQNIAEKNAEAAAQQAGVNEDAQRRSAAMAIGRGAAAAADGSGLSGTNLDVLGQSAAAAELDALNIRYQGKLGIISNTAQANLLDMEAANANDAGYLNAAAAGLSAYGSYTKGKTKPGGLG
jgi:hypothetical protein